MKWKLLFIIILLSSMSYSSVEDSEIIFSSKELIIQKTVLGGIEVANLRRPLQWVSAEFDFHPIDYYRQEVLSEIHNPELEFRDENLLRFKVNNVDTDLIFNSTYLVKTKNEYKQINSFVNFPLKEIPDYVEKYTKETNSIDLTPEIRTTASLVASGKNDLFEVAQEIAYWVVRNVEYDLSTLGKQATQKASWVYNSRAGVCDDLSLLFVAMMRSLNVPSRIVYGISYSDSDLFEDPWSPHAWAEVYFPSYGWVPFDLTYNQFGFIDASHIKFKDSVDISKISSSYEWRGYDLDIAWIDINPIEFDLKVISASGRVEQDFDAEINLLHDEISIGSYNLIEVVFNNKKDHYISSLILLKGPKEIEFQTENKIPIYLKPREQKKYYFLIKISDQLSSRFIYTMPISVITSFNHIYTNEFKVSSDYSYISINNINTYLSSISDDFSKDDLEIVCDFNKKETYVGMPIELICNIFNSGNTFLKNGEICFISKDLNVNDCRKKDITISERITVEKRFSSNNPSNNEILVKVNFQGIEKENKYSFLVKDKPKIIIGDIDFPDDFKIGDNVVINLFAKKESSTIPENLEIRVTLNDKNTLIWDFDSLKESTNFKIPLSSYLLKPGNNDVNFFIIWEDSNENSYFIEKTISKQIDNFNFFSKIKSWFYRLLN